MSLTATTTTAKFHILRYYIFIYFLFVHFNYNIILYIYTRIIGMHIIICPVYIPVCRVSRVTPGKDHAVLNNTLNIIFL